MKKILILLIALSFCSLSSSAFSATNWWENIQKGQDAAQARYDAEVERERKRVMEAQADEDRNRKIEQQKAEAKYLKKLRELQIKALEDEAAALAKQQEIDKAERERKLNSANDGGEWKKIGVLEGNTFYIYKDTKENNGYVYSWFFSDNVKDKLPDGFMSAKTYIQGDCGVFRFKYLSLILYEQPMGKGTGETFNPPNPEWYYPVPETIEAVLLDEVCKLVE